MCKQTDLNSHRTAHKTAACSDRADLTELSSLSNKYKKSAGNSTVQLLSQWILCILSTRSFVYITVSILRPEPFYRPLLNTASLLFKKASTPSLESSDTIQIPCVSASASSSPFRSISILRFSRRLAAPMARRTPKSASGPAAVPQIPAPHEAPPGSQSPGCRLPPH